jgi:hypothetical protein
MTTPPLGPSGSPSPNDLPFGGRVGDQLRSQEGPGGGSGSGAGGGRSADRPGTTGAAPAAARAATAGRRTAAPPTGARPSGAPRVVWGRTRTSRAC